MCRESWNQIMAKETFETFTEKWINYVKTNKRAADIPEEDWKSFFAPSNPVAGINFGALTDSYNKKTTNERKTIKDKWTEISLKFKALYGLTVDNDIKTKLREIRDFVLGEIQKNGGHEKEVAVNRILVTLYPEKLLTIPGTNDVKKLAELFQIVDIDKKDWIDLCFEIKKPLKDKYPNMMHWAAYLQLVQESNLTKNYNLILTGAPGTGKTYMARQMAANLIGCKKVDDLKNNPQFEFVQFHPSYDYTDFVEGLRPTKDSTSGQVVFERHDGSFKSFCAKAANDEDKGKKYVFVIDEINRGEISKIFGELFFSIDPGYREIKDRIPVRTQYQNLIDADTKLTVANYPFKNGFYVPSNVYVIGTMNDIDRSVESMDFAFRRRFSFYEIKATDTQYSILKDCSLMTEAIIRMNNLNKAIEKIDGLSPAYHIGAAYFKKIKLYESEKGCWESLWNNHIQGLLYEYLRGLPQKEINNKLKDLKDAYNKKEETIEEMESLGS